MPCGSTLSSGITLTGLFINSRAIIFHFANIAKNMTTPDNKAIITGSGVDGLSTGIILAKLGFDVVVVEKNQQPGGMIRSYEREGIHCDVGVHYLGSLD